MDAPRNGPAGFAEDRDGFAIFDHDFVGDPIIGAKFEVRVPRRAHPFAAADGLAEGIDEGVIVGHQRGEAFDVVGVDAVHEGDGGGGGTHFYHVTNRRPRTA